MKNNAAKFIHEFARMCKAQDGCAVEYDDCPTIYCPLYNFCGEDINCFENFMEYPEKVVDIVEQWSEANPIRPPKTILSEFIAKFPDTPFGENGVPQFCIKVLGYNGMDQDMCTANKGACTLCWNTPLIKEEKSASTPMSEPKSDGIIIIDMTADSDPDGAYFDHAPIVKTPDFPAGMDTFIKELCVKLGWDKPVITA